MPEYTQVFGTIEESFDPGQLISHNSMVIDAIQLTAAWRRCSLSSDFWARYTSFFVPPQAIHGHLDRAAANSVFSYLLNELFENCAKFSRGEQTEIRYECWVLPDRLVFQMSNHILPGAVESFAALIRQLLEKDPEELYFATLEENALSNAGSSGLGYLTLIKDYGIRFGFGFQKIGPHDVRVDVQAQVSRKET